jgi:hypothetical protein
MVVSRKIEKIINKGESVNIDSKNKKKKNILLSIPIFLLEDIDNLLDDRPGMSRNALIVEAIQEKIKRSNK